MLHYCFQPSSNLTVFFPHNKILPNTSLKNLCQWPQGEGGVKLLGQWRWTEQPSTLLPASSPLGLRVSGLLEKDGEPAVQINRDSHLQPPSSEVSRHCNTLMLGIQSRNQKVKGSVHTNNKQLSSLRAETRGHWAADYFSENFDTDHYACLANWDDREARTSGYSDLYIDQV